MSQKTDHDGRQKGDEYVTREGLRRAVLVEARDGLPDFSSIEPTHRENGTELNHDFKKFRETIVEAQQVTDDDHVTG